MQIETRFQRSLRLLSPVDFSRVFKDSRRSADRCFTVLFRRNRLAGPRLGLAISKKHLKRAVDRNLVKRLVRESFRRNQAALAGADIVVLSRRGMDIGNTKALAGSLETHWERVHRCMTQS